MEDIPHVWSQLQWHGWKFPLPCYDYICKCFMSSSSRTNDNVTDQSRLYKFYRYGASLRSPCELRFYSLLTYLFVIWNGWEVNILSQHPIGGILIESKQPFECCKWQITLSAFMPPLFLFQHRWSIKALTWWNIIFLFTSFSVLPLWYTCIFNIFPIMLF